MTVRAETDGAETATAEGFAHVGLVFGSVSRLCAVAGPLVRAAAAAGDHVLVVLDEDGLEALRAELGREVSESVRFVGRASFYDAPGRTLAALHRLTLLHPERRITVVGQPVLPSHDPFELREWQRLDSVLDTALSRTRIRLLCVHDARALAAPVLDTVWRTHPAMAAQTGPRPNPNYRGPSQWHAYDTALAPPEGPVEHLEIIPDLPALRDAVVRLAEAFDVPAARTRDLVVAVNEVAANVLEHGAGKGVISLWRPEGRLVCDVFDEAGLLTDPFSGYYPTDALSVRGYGLWITRQVCDFMEVRGGPEGSVVRLHFKV